MPFRARGPFKDSEYADDEVDDSPVARRKASKRRVVDSDEGEDMDEATVASSSHSRSKRLRRPSQRVLEGMDVEVDVEGDHFVDSRFLATTAEDPLPPIRVTTSKSRSSKSSKKKHVVQTSDEEDDFVGDPVVDEYDDDPQHSYSGEDDFIDNTYETERSSRTKSAAPRKAGKVSASTGSGKKYKPKAKVPDKAIMMKDERRIATSRASSTTTNDTTSGTKRPRPKDAEQESDVVEGTNAAVGALPAASANADDVSGPKDTERPPPPKRPKLPTIRKIKSAAPNAQASSTPAKAPNATAKATPNDAKSTSASSVRPAMYVGMADFDLRNPSVYSELFKNASGSTPRSGLNRKEKEEERLKELNRMRDEARAKREAEANHCFDLQAQVEKIHRFEERLHASRSSALFPNCLGARWRDDWELRRRREQAAEGGLVS